MSVNRHEKTKLNAYYWIFWADQFYITARYLFWKGFNRDFAFIGAHTIELYLKAYLINMTGCYPKSHNLRSIYKECKIYDDFFNDDELCKIFEQAKANHLLGTDWTMYLNAIKYPESIGNSPWYGAWALQQPGAIVSLDKIAAFARNKAGKPNPPDMTDVIHDLLNGRPVFGQSFEPSTLDEVRQSFLRDNRYFSP